MSYSEAFQDPRLSGLIEAEQTCGPPHRVLSQVSLRLEQRGRRPFGRDRCGEILMVLPRPDGVLVHTKSFYPPGILRLPSGGIRRGEPILEAAAREVVEETGLRLAPRRFLFHLVHDLEDAGTSVRFHSLAFLYPESTAAVEPQDTTERITEMRSVPWTGIPALAAALEALAPEWAAWGRFRAAPHRVLLELRQGRPEMFDSLPA